MNGRYLIAFLLIGGMVYGLTTAVGDMLAEEDPMSVYSAQVEWSSVPGAGMPVRVGSPAVSVPMSSGNSSVLFHHPAVYGAAPQGYAAADRPSVYAGGSAVGSYAAHGLYLISSGSVQSYGGGAEGGLYTSAGNGSAIPFATSSASGMPMAAPASVSAYSLAPSYSASPSYAFAPQSTRSAQSATAAYASADQTLASRKGAQRRKNGVTIEDTYYQWLQSNMWAFGAGADNLSESQVRALWDALCADNDDFALTYTYDEFYNWFLSKQDDETFKWKLPVGDGIPFLLLLCVGYAVVRYKQQKNQWI